MCSFSASPPLDVAPGSPRGGFLAHLISYLAVNVGLLLINLLTSPDVVWAVWPLLGWGIGVSMHGLRVLLKKQPSTSPSNTPSGTTHDVPDWERVEKRLQNLEAIVAHDESDSFTEHFPEASTR